MTARTPCAPVRLTPLLNVKLRIREGIHVHDEHERTQRGNVDSSQYVPTSWSRARGQTCGARSRGVACVINVCLDPRAEPRSMRCASLAGRTQVAAWDGFISDTRYHVSRLGSDPTDVMLYAF